MPNNLEYDLDQYKSLRVSNIKPGDIKKVGPKPLSQLSKIEEEITANSNEESIGVIFLMASRHLQGVSLNALAKENGIGSGQILTAVFKHFGIPTLTRAEISKAKWQDPTFRQAQSEGLKRTWQDPEYRTRSSAERARRWVDPVYRAKQVARVKAMWQDPQFRARQSEIHRQLWDTPDYRDRVLGSMSKVWYSEKFKARQGELLRQRRQDPVFNAHNAEATRRELVQRWQDPKFREKFLEAARRMRLDPANVGKYNLPTIKGERSDIGFYAQSTWEANFARALLYYGREFDVRQNFILEVPEEYKELFPEGKTETNIDFLSLDPRGNLVLYEIMSHPKKDPVGWAKLEMLSNQYPMFRVVPVTERFYRRLERLLEDRINANPLFAGWETKKDNLKSNPAKFQ